jgi:hypothetical protein
MTFCTNCGQDTETDDKYCVNCGYPLQKPSVDGVNDDDLPLGIIAGFNIFPGKNKILEFPDQYNMVIYPDSIVFAKYNKEWKKDSEKLLDGFVDRIRNLMRLDEVYANTYRTWPAYKVLEQDPENFAYLKDDIESIIINSSMTMGSSRRNTNINILSYHFTFVTKEGKKTHTTDSYPREIELLRYAFGDLLDGKVHILHGFMF